MSTFRRRLMMAMSSKVETMQFRISVSAGTSSATSILSVILNGLTLFQRRQGDVTSFVLPMLSQIDNITIEKIVATKDYWRVTIPFAVSYDGELYREGYSFEIQRDSSEQNYDFEYTRNPLDIKLDKQLLFVVNNASTTSLSEITIYKGTEQVYNKTLSNISFDGEDVGNNIVRIKQIAASQNYYDLTALSRLKGIDETIYEINSPMPSIMKSTIWQYIFYTML